MGIIYLNVSLFRIYSYEIALLKHKNLLWWLTILTI